MTDEIRIAVDAMGGDNAPGEIIGGVVSAVDKMEQVSVILVGKKPEIESCLRGKSYRHGSVTIHDASQVIEMSEHPVNAIRHKKDSSMVVALRLLKEDEADAFVSAGNSGAVVVGAQGIVGRTRGVLRPPFAAIVPTRERFTLLLDAGANIDARPEHLAQWAKLGTIYMESACHVESPKVGIVNIGAEEEKGNNLVQASFPLLRSMSAAGEINFIGSCEVRDIPCGVCDVAVCDGFTGNVIIKMYEGTAKMLLSELKKAFFSGLRPKIGGLLVKDALRTTLGKFDAKNYGGAPVLGLKGLVVKMHGSAKAAEVERAIEQCVQFYREDVNGKIASYFTAANHKQPTTKGDRD